MKESNEKLITLLQGNLSLISSTIDKIEMSRDLLNGVEVMVRLKLLYSKEPNVVILQFSQVESYSFAYNSDHIFYNVENLKFFMTADGMIYISFDPADERETINKDDNNFILCENVVGVFT